MLFGKRLCKCICCLFVDISIEKSVAYFLPVDINVVVISGYLKYIQRIFAVSLLFVIANSVNLIVFIFLFFLRMEASQIVK